MSTTELHSELLGQMDGGAAASNQGFLGHVFKFDLAQKAEMMNLIQYAILAIVPIVLLNKSLHRIVPEADAEKGSLEILAEILFQVVALFLGVYFIDRIITYIPTYSEVSYTGINLFSVVFGILVVLISIQSKLGNKINILTDRVYELWNGKPVPEKKEDQSEQKMMMRHLGHQVSRADSLDMKQGFTPTYPDPAMTGVGARQPRMDVAGMYQNLPQPPREMFEPMAANAGGSGAFGSFF